MSIEKEVSRSNLVLVTVFVIMYDVFGSNFHSSSISPNWNVYRDMDCTPIKVVLVFAVDGYFYIHDSMFDHDVNVDNTSVRNGNYGTLLVNIWSIVWVNSSLTLLAVIYRNMYLFYSDRR